MISRTDIVAEAREWLGTPYRHQASMKGAGTDCLGLIRGMWRRFYDAEPELLPRYTGDWSETTGEETLLLAAARLLEPKSCHSTDIGEVLIFRMRNAGVAKHLGLSATRDGVPTFIHAYTGHGVIETPLSDPWLRKIAGRFDFPGGVS